MSMMSRTFEAPAASRASGDYVWKSCHTRLGWRPRPSPAPRIPRQNGIGTEAKTKSKKNTENAMDSHPGPAVISLYRDHLF